MYRASDRRGAFVFILYLLAGLVVGGFLGNLAVSLLQRAGGHWLDWLVYEQLFGFKEPFVTLALGFVDFQFGFLFHFSVAGVLGMIAAFFIYQRLK